jgi:hypothetical protein
MWGMQRMRVNKNTLSLLVCTSRVKQPFSGPSQGHYGCHSFPGVD